MIRLVVISFSLLIMLGCSRPLGEPLDITWENYNEQPLICFNELQLGQLIVYRYQDEEIVGKLVNFDLDDSLCINPEGKVEPQTVRICIYDGKDIFSRVVSENDLDRLRLQVRKID